LYFIRYKQEKHYFMSPSGWELLTIRIQTKRYVYDLTDFSSDDCQEEQDQNRKA
jgi:hypothetical protein